MARKRTSPAIPTERELTWRQHLDDARAEGLKLGEYCDRKGLVRTQAFWWRAEIRRRDARRRTNGSTESPPAFLPVVIRQRPQQPQETAPLRVTLPGGRNIDVAGDFDERVLGKLVRTLEGLAC